MGYVAVTRLLPDKSSGSGKEGRRAKEQRTIGLYTKVTPQEREAIQRRMELCGVRNLRQYLRKMALNGYIVQLDLSELQHIAALLRNATGNLNQIARRVNETGCLYAADVADLRHGYGEVWAAVQTLTDKLTGL